MVQQSSYTCDTDPVDLVGGCSGMSSIWYRFHRQALGSLVLQAGSHAAQSQSREQYVNDRMDRIRSYNERPGSAKSRHQAKGELDD
jgi:hypothetical protein